MNMITKIAAMLVRERGMRMSRKKRIGPAPSMRAASASSSGTVRKNCRNRNVAVAEAISGIESPAYEFSMPSEATTSNVGRMRTSTGSISVMNTIQNASMRRGKRKYTIAKAEISEIAILPTAISSAITNEFHSISPTGVPPAWLMPEESSRP